MADTEQNKQIVLAFLDDFTTFDAAVYEPYLVASVAVSAGVVALLLFR